MPELPTPTDRGGFEIPPPNSDGPDAGPLSEVAQHLNVLLAAESAAEAHDAIDSLSEAVDEAILRDAAKALNDDKQPNSWRKVFDAARRKARLVQSAAFEVAEIPADPEPPAWLVRDWLPAGRVAFLSGRGGVGKSRLALQLAAAVATGQDGPCAGIRWLPGTDGRNGLLTARGGPVVLATWEDDPHTIGWRLASIRGALPGIDAARVRDRLHLVDCAALGPLWRAAPGEAWADLTPTGERLRSLARERQAALLIVDPLAAAFAANENDRGVVRDFMAGWDAWARETGCAVLLVSHPAKATAGEGADYSGSTDWRNAARAAWLLSMRPVPGEERNRDAERYHVLSLDKSSYGPLPDRCWLEAQDTVWREMEQPSLESDGLTVA